MIQCKHVLGSVSQLLKCRNFHEMGCTRTKSERSQTLTSTVPIIISRKDPILYPYTSHKLNDLPLLGPTSELKICHRNTDTFLYRHGPCLLNKICILKSNNKRWTLQTIDVFVRSFRLKTRKQNLLLNLENSTVHHGHDESLRTFLRQQGNPESTKT